MKLEAKIDVTNNPKNPYLGCSTNQMVLAFIEHYGLIEGAHHKDWLLDQIARIIHGTPVKVTMYCYDDGTRRFGFDTVENPSESYNQWVKTLCTGKDGEFHEDYYSIGIAP